jgi:hypothetical protein
VCPEPAHQSELVLVQHDRVTRDGLRRFAARQQ